MYSTPAIERSLEKFRPAVLKYGWVIENNHVESVSIVIRMKKNKRGN